MSQEIHIYISGLVQGVGFRATVQRHAVLYGITGYARNLPDGRVEICAQGKEDHIQFFLQMIQSKPGQANIANIKTTLRLPLQTFDSFEIR